MLIIESIIVRHRNLVQLTLKLQLRHPLQVKVMVENLSIFVYPS